MKLDISEIEFSHVDIKRNITLPNHMSADLAHLIGIQIGDGYLKKEDRGKEGFGYKAIYSGNMLTEYNWYVTYLRPLIKQLFNLDTNVKESTKNTVEIRIGSKAIFSFLNQVCGIGQSPKRNIHIPTVIMDNDLEIKRAFLRGLSDTDFSLTFKKRTRCNDYPVLYHMTCDQILHDDIRRLLFSLGFNNTGGYRISKRYTDYHDSYYVQISGRKMLAKWMDEIKPSSHNFLRRYNQWKKQEDSY